MLCKHCQKYKVEHLKADGLFYLLEIPNGKWESISMDVHIGLPTTSCGHHAIQVVVSQLTMMCQLISKKKTFKTPKLVQLFEEHLQAVWTNSQ